MNKVIFLSDKRNPKMHKILSKFSIGNNFFFNIWEIPLLSQDLRHCFRTTLLFFFFLNQNGTLQQLILKAVSFNFLISKVVLFTYQNSLSSFQLPHYYTKELRRALSAIWFLFIHIEDSLRASCAHRMYHLCGSRSPALTDN